MMEQARKCGATFLHEEVLSLELSNEISYKIKTNDRVSETYSIIIATGASAKWLNLPNESKYWNFGISTSSVKFILPNLLINQYKFVFKFKNGK